MMSDVGMAGRTRARHGWQRFWQERDGAVTVDWVVLTGFLVLLGMATTFYIATSVPQVADKVGEHLENTTVMPN